MDSHEKFLENGVRATVAGLCLCLTACPATALTSPERIFPSPRGGEREVCMPESRQTAPCDELCPPTRRVGPCKQALPGWSETTVLRASTRSTGSTCVYEWTDPTHGPQDFPRFSEPDCRVATQQEPPSQSMADAFVHGAYGVDPALVAESALADGIMIAVVDTAPQGGGTDQADARGRHGRTMAAIVETVACGPDPAAQCTAAVETYLGLPRLWNSDGVDLENGGHVGYQSDLGVGISGAIAAWNERKEIDPGTRLIINLSVGWEAVCSDSSFIKNLLIGATDAGALVLAANGNRPIGSCVEGPTAPAIWEETGLVHGITAIDDSGRKLATFRPASNTRIAAPGFMAVVEQGGVMHGPLSGSSVATAVVSGIAARVWSAYPEYTAGEVMDQIWKKGVVPGNQEVVKADSYDTQKALPDQHVVSLCSAMGLTGCNDAPPGKLANTWWVCMEDVPCEALVIAPTSSSESSGCDANAPLPVWVAPQPNIPPCPDCGIKGNTAKLRLAPEFEDGLLSTTITLSYGGGTIRTYVYDSLNLQTNNWYDLINDEFLLGTVSASAGRIEMTFQAPNNGIIYTVGNVIPIEPVDP
jgi:hypothetical protein